ncbi:MAG: metallophosphoesterase family protein [Candidatus Eiseniibacteriota bacterium]
MPIAALYDIHGNLPALKCVLEEIDRLACDLIVIGGDVALGPMPKETLDLLATRGSQVRYILGNCDRDMATAKDGLLEPNIPWQARLGWAAEQITPAQRDFLASLPLTLTLDIPELGPTLFCHATPRSEDEIITLLTPESRLAGALEGVKARTIICGHTHMQYDRTVLGYRIINSGSVGMPFEERMGAYWTLLGPSVTLMRTEYYVHAAVHAAMATTMPEAEQWAHEFLIAPPSPAKMSETYEKLGEARARDQEA